MPRYCGLRLRGGVARGTERSPVMADPGSDCIESICHQNVAPQFLGRGDPKFPLESVDLIEKGKRDPDKIDELSYFVGRPLQGIKKYIGLWMISIGSLFLLFPVKSGIDRFVHNTEEKFPQLRKQLSDGYRDLNSRILAVGESEWVISELIEILNQGATFEDYNLGSEMNNQCLGRVAEYLQDKSLEGELKESIKGDLTLYLEGERSLIFSFRECQRAKFSQGAIKQVGKAFGVYVSNRVAFLDSPIESLEGGRQIAKNIIRIVNQNTLTIDERESDKKQEENISKFLDVINVNSRVPLMLSGALDTNWATKICNKFWLLVRSFSHI